MNRLRQSIFCLAAALTVVVAQAQNPPLPPNTPSPLNLVPLPPPQAPSPVAFFRSLLAMSPKERADFLTNRPPGMRARIIAKIHEYQILNPDERELRLSATELRWYLTPLLSLAPTNRAERVALVPDNLRPLVKDRLQQWDILPPPLKQEFLENDRALHYFARIVPPGTAASDDLSNEQRQKIAGQFNEFFELTPGEKEKALKTLSAAEQAEMQKTLQSFEHLPPPQRLMCLRNYAKFAGMSNVDRSEFLKNAEHWSQMSPAERQTWRDLVAHVPEWPPVPPPIVPGNLIPHTTPKISKTNVATN
jgi:hypothetical protein